MGEVENPTYGYGKQHRPLWTTRDREAETIRRILRRGGYRELTDRAAAGQFAVEGANASLDDASPEPYYVACTSDDLVDGPDRFAALLRAAGYQLRIDPEDDRVLIVQPWPASAGRFVDRWARWGWAAVAVSFGLTAVVGVFGEPPALGARLFRLVLPLLVLLVFLTSRLFTGRVTAALGFACAAAVFVLEAPVIYLHAFALARAHDNDEYTAALYALLLIVAMAASMTLVAFLDRARISRGER